MCFCRYARGKMLELRKAVECYVAGTAQYLSERVVFVCWAVGVGLRAEFLVGEACLVGRRCRCVAYVLAEDWECLPKSKSFEGEDEFNPRLLCDVCNQLQILPEF